MTMTLTPANALKMCYAIANEVCPRWDRPETQVGDSRGSTYNHQTKLDEKDMYDATNFYWWSINRESEPGLVRKLFIVWGDSAIHHGLATVKKQGGPIRFDETNTFAAVLLQFTLDETRIGVPGDQSIKGTTNYRLHQAVLDAVFDAGLGNMVNPKAVFWPKKF